MALGEEIPADFYSEFGAWIRIEPRARSNDIGSGLAARTADPLWMLARQWQTGELEAEDAGSPIEATLAYSIQTLDRVRLSDGTQLSPLPDMPLEALVEAEPAPMDWRLRVRIGQQFERIARSEFGEDSSEAIALISGLRDRFPIEIPRDTAWTQTDQVTCRFLAFVAGRVVDGGPLLDKARLGTLTPPNGVSADQLGRVIGELISWFDRLFLQPNHGGSGAWRGRKLDYQFEVNASGNGAEIDAAVNPIHLIAPDYRNGVLDWHTFSALTPQSENWHIQQTAVMTPTRVSVGGTSPRWWAFEDSATHFGAVEVAATDLAQILLMEFVLVYGDDWFSVSVPMEKSRLVRVDTLTVSNVFGETLEIRPVTEMVQRAAQEVNADPLDPMLRWEVFTLAMHDKEEQWTLGNKGVLLIPPIAGYREESDALEEVHFLRDEGANLVWGVEHIVMNGLGSPVRGIDAQRERKARVQEEELTKLKRQVSALRQQLASSEGPQRAALEALILDTEQRISLNENKTVPPRGGAVPVYQLASAVPANRIPFSPVNAQAHSDPAHPRILLQRSQTLEDIPDKRLVVIPEMSRLLSLVAENPLIWLEESTVLRSGVRVQVAHRRMRWTDGKTYVWTGKKVLVGGGEGASGLRFDVIK